MLSIFKIISSTIFALEQIFFRFCLQVSTPILLQSSNNVIVATTFSSLPVITPSGLHLSHDICSRELLATNIHAVLMLPKQFSGSHFQRLILPYR
jgi:hypothetical protein